MGSIHTDIVGELEPLKAEDDGEGPNNIVTEPVEVILVGIVE